MHSLLNGKYIRLPVKNIFYLNLYKRDFGIFIVQTILKDKPLTIYATGKKLQENIQIYLYE
jgi:hypothetical protein